MVEYVSTYVAGTDYYDAKKVLKLCKDEDLFIENDDYSMKNSDILDEYFDGDRIYKYEPVSLSFRLESEPDNPHDPNALKVIVTQFDKEYMVGYVPSNKFKKVIESISNNITPSLSIVGGSYKQVDDDEVKTVKSEYSFMLEYGIKK